MKSARLALVASLGLSVSMLFSTACEKKLEKEQCNLVRKKAFDLLSVAQPCATDADCAPPTWPECNHPSNHKTIDALVPIKKEFDDGKCEEPKKDCKAPDVYCKQGLCVIREKGMPDSTEDIRIE